MNTTARVILSETGIGRKGRHSGRDPVLEHSSCAGCRLHWSGEFIDFLQVMQMIVEADILFYSKDVDGLSIFRKDHVEPGGEAHADCGLTPVLLNTLRRDASTEGHEDVFELGLSTGKVVVNPGLGAVEEVGEDRHELDVVTLDEGGEFVEETGIGGGGSYLSGLRMDGNLGRLFEEGEKLLFRDGVGGTPKLRKLVE